jgi:ferric-dicitrate binding protein FerR (iron transport regulator)
MEFKLIIKKLNKGLSSAEEIIFSKWHEESKQHKSFFENVKTNHHKNSDDIDVAKGWSAIENKLFVPVKRKMYWYYAVAASIVLLISIGFIFNTFKDKQLHEAKIAEHNIEIGTDKATLTLEDGSDIALKKGETYSTKNLKSNGEQLIYNTTQNVEKPKIAYNYLTIPRGGQYYIKLSDGTQVWLNADSKLKYPVSFVEGETRQVELVYGEAYFDVSPSTAHHGSTFKVNTLNQNIEVMGTEFNIKAYKDDPAIYTTLVEGKVSVSNNDTARKDLKPGEQSIFNLQNNAIKVVNADITTHTAWKNGLFMFDKEPLQEIMKTLSRWYDVTIEFKNLEKQNILFSGILKRSNGINDLLDSFKKTKEVTFEFEPKKIIIN